MAKKQVLTDFDVSKLLSIPTGKAPEEAEPQTKTDNTPHKGVLRPALYEKRTRRVQLVFSPSLYEAAEEHSRQLGFRSFNDYVNRLIEEELKGDNAE